MVEWKALYYRTLQATATGPKKICNNSNSLKKTKNHLKENFRK